MPTILNRNPLQNRRQVGSRSMGGNDSNQLNEGIFMTPVVFGGLHSVNGNADVSLGGSLERLSISSGRSSTSIQTGQSASSMRRSSSMSFSDYQNLEPGRGASKDYRPPLYPTQTFIPVDEDGETWGHFVDVATADEEMSRFARVLPSRP